MSDAVAAAADADPSVALQSRADLEANLTEYQTQLEQVKIDVLELERAREKRLRKDEEQEIASTEEMMTRASERPSLSHTHPRPDLLFTNAPPPQHHNHHNQTRSRPSSRPSRTMPSTSSLNRGSWR